MGNLAGKGLTSWELSKLLFYMGVTVVKMVLPLTILLAAIMTFGGFGERYELAAMKSAGISLIRVIKPLFFIVIILSALLYLFSNNIIPDFQKKAKNMLYNIASSRPALNFTPGQFIDSVPGMTIKFDDISGKNGENVTGVFIHKLASFYEDNQTVVANHGKFVPAEDKNFLKLILFDGYIFQDQNDNRATSQRNKQSNQSIKFDTLVQHFDVSLLINKALEEETISDNYQFQTFNQLSETLKERKRDDSISFRNMSNEILRQQYGFISHLYDYEVDKSKPTPLFKLDSLEQEERLDILYNSYNKLQISRKYYEEKEDLALYSLKYYARIVIYQQQIISYSVTCIIFFLIGSSLGSIIRKGGLGLPVIIAIMIFILFYVMNLMVENISWKGELDPYWAAWIPNLTLLPLGIWMTYKALTDSQLFDVEKYKAMLKPIIKRFSRSKEHARYQ